MERLYFIAYVNLFFDKMMKQINIYDSADEIKHKLERLNAEVLPDDEPEGDDEQQSLSSREKEIVVCVVKGMTNREIADRLFLSAYGHHPPP